MLKNKESIKIGSNFPKTFTQVIKDIAYEAIHDWGKYRNLSTAQLQKIRVADVYYNFSKSDTFNEYTYTTTKRYCYHIIFENISGDIELFEEYIYNFIYNHIDIDIDVRVIIVY
ncbi:MAG: hypothetical protein ACO295_08280 [Sediminibacterium sp.]|jgi:hypothetical protein